MFDAIIAGGVTVVRFNLDTRNLATDAAVNSFINFRFPADFFTGVSVMEPSSVVSTYTVQMIYIPNRSLFSREYIFADFADFVAILENSIDEQINPRKSRKPRLN